jgi:hypothetical protein
MTAAGGNPGVLLRRRPAATALVAALIAAGMMACGGDDGEEAAEENGVSRSQYIRRANNLCARLADDIEELARESFEDLERQPTEQEMRTYHEGVAQLQRNTLTALRTLPAPDGEEAQVTAIYDEYEHVLDEVERLPPTSPGAPSGVRLQRFREMARAYGLDECAKG